MPLHNLKYYYFALYKKHSLSVKHRKSFLFWSAVKVYDLLCLPRTPPEHYHISWRIYPPFFGLWEAHNSQLFFMISLSYFPVDPFAKQGKRTRPHRKVCGLPNGACLWREISLLGISLFVIETWIVILFLILEFASYVYKMTFAG